MTTDLTPEQIRVRCAEISGIPMMESRWKFSYKWAGHLLNSYGYRSEEHARSERARMSKDFVCFAITEYQAAAELPDYTNDLNAINAAVLRLPMAMRLRWTYRLLESVIPDFDYEEEDLWL